MPYDEKLKSRIQTLVKPWKNIQSKKIFGGICHLVNGNMFAGIYKEFLIVRVGLEAYQKALQQMHTRVFDITGKVMKGWVMVAPAACDTDKSLKKWLELGKKYARSLPPK
jgi:TfoX/Sxy family transcriptional regulator of competence genes